MSVPHYLTRRGFESALSERGHYMDDLYYVAMYAAEKLLDKYKALSEKGERKEKELSKAVDEKIQTGLGVPMNTKSCLQGGHPGVKLLQELLLANSRVYTLTEHLRQMETEWERTPVGARSSDTIDEYQEGIIELRAELAALCVMRGQARRTIREVQDPTQRSFLEHRYYFGKSIRETIQAMNYSESSVYNIQRKAVKSFCKIYSKS